MFEGPASALDPGASEALMRLHLKSSAEDRELSALICGGSVFPLESESTERMAKTKIGPREVQGLCGEDDNAIYLHTHGNFLPHPSLADHRANEKIFSLPGVRHSCIAGTSGVFCTDRLGREISYPWGDGYYRAIEGDPRLAIERGDALLCDRRGEEYECEISREGFIKGLGRFKNVSLGGAAIMGELGTDIFSQVHSPKETLECTVARGEERGDTLNCYRRSEAEILNGRSATPRCAFVNLCRPKV
jgi:hypothetical protein